MGDLEARSKIFHFLHLTAISDSHHSGQHLCWSRFLALWKLGSWLPCPFRAMIEAIACSRLSAGREAPKATPVSLLSSRNKYFPLLGLKKSKRTFWPTQRIWQWIFPCEMWLAMCRWRWLLHDFWRDGFWTWDGLHLDLSDSLYSAQKNRTWCIYLFFLIES